MSRRGLLSILVAETSRQLKAHARVEREAQRALARAQLEAERALIHKAREANRLAKEQRKLYEESRTSEVASLNSELNERKRALHSILERKLLGGRPGLFGSLRNEVPKFELPKELAIPATAPSREQFEVKALGLLLRLIPGVKARYRRNLEAAESQYRQALSEYQVKEAERKAKIDKFKFDHEERVSALLAEINDLETAYQNGNPSGIVQYNSIVLQRSEYPDGFPQRFRAAFVPESRELVIEYELPSPEVVPTTAEYHYVKNRDTIDEKKANATEVRELYREVVAAVTLGTMNEVFAADEANHLAVVVFNGLVQTVDPATGKDIRPHLVSVRVTKDRFKEVDLTRVDMVACLRNLGAQLTPRPTELVPIKPIIEFDMADKRFVDQSDILSGLDSRPNIMDLNPYEFEALVSNLFGKMGLESKLTRSSRDGGVDAVAFDTRPVLGGKVVIQAKRYRHTVGVAAVRDLYGTMINEGANKGILVTTSGYGPDAYEFAKDKPIELIDGSGLLYLLEQVGTKARIDFPPEG